jgi:excisionase family DNA binding protein
MEKRFVDVEELSQYLGVKANTIYCWVSQKRIPFMKFNRLVRFDIAQIDEWIRMNNIEGKNNS